MLARHIVAVGHEYFFRAFSQDPWPQVRQDTERVSRPHLFCERSGLHTRWTQLAEVSCTTSNVFHQEEFSLRDVKQFTADLSCCCLLFLILLYPVTAPPLPQPYFFVNPLNFISTVICLCRLLPATVSFSSLLFSL
jgi:hypothetical protein